MLAGNSIQSFHKRTEPQISYYNKYSVYSIHIITNNITENKLFAKITQALSGVQNNILKTIIKIIYYGRALYQFNTVLIHASTIKSLI